ncbi:hypothetical protein WN943_029132 [Citrus x changshan-huyou]
MYWNLSYVAIQSPDIIKLCIWISILNVEVIDKSGPPDSRPTLPVEKLYIYRTVAGQRIDMLGFVWNMDEDFASRLS